VCVALKGVGGKGGLVLSTCLVGRRLTGCQTSSDQRAEKPRPEEQEKRSPEPRQKAVTSTAEGCLARRDKEPESKSCPPKRVTPASFYVLASRVWLSNENIDARAGAA
jgi:hypothetical protein